VALFFRFLLLIFLLLPFLLASCLQVFPGVQIRLVPSTHEIIMFGRHIFMGYVDDPESSANAIDDRGFFHTSDIGNSDRSGFLYVTGRLPDLIITAGGEHIPPEAIEARIKRKLPFVSNAVLVGDKRKFLATLLTLKVVLDQNGFPTDKLAPETIEALKEAGSLASTMQEVLQDRTQKLRTYIDRAIDEMNSQAPSEHHRVVRWQFLPHDLSPLGGELTPTMKLRRRFVTQKNASIITAIYGSEEMEDYTQAEWYHGGISRQVTCILSLSPPPLPPPHQEIREMKTRKEEEEKEEKDTDAVTPFSCCRTRRRYGSVMAAARTAGS
jgi:long-subunit acyl-CoA synthetase (AMP-forming)